MRQGVLGLMTGVVGGVIFCTSCWQIFWFLFHLPNAYKSHSRALEGALGRLERLSRLRRDELSVVLVAGLVGLVSLRREKKEVICGVRTVFPRARHCQLVVSLLAKLFAQRRGAKQGDEPRRRNIRSASSLRCSRVAVFVASLPTPFAPRVKRS